MEENEVIDQSVLANDVSNKIPYDFVDSFLVKTLDPIKVKKEFSKPVSDNKAVKDENGIEAVDFDKVETEVKEVDSDFRKGIVLKVPSSYKKQISDMEQKWTPSIIEVGDIVLFRDRAGMIFDLLKDSKLVRYFDIVAIEKK